MAYRAKVRDLEYALHKQKTASTKLTFEKQLKELSCSLEPVSPFTIELSPQKFELDDLDYEPIKESTLRTSSMFKAPEVTFTDDWFETPIKTSIQSPLMQTLKASDLRNSDSSHQGRKANIRGTPVKEMLQYDLGSVGKLQDDMTLDELIASPKRIPKFYLPVQEVQGNYMTLDSSFALSTGRPNSGIFTLYSSAHQAIEKLPAHHRSAVLEVSVDGKVIETSPGEVLSASVTPLRPLVRMS